jgi:DNA replication protein DnaC
MAKALGQAAIQHGNRVLHLAAHLLLEELIDTTLDGTRKAVLTEPSIVPLPIVDDLGARKLPPTTAEDLLELKVRRYEREPTVLTSNRLQELGALPSPTSEGPRADSIRST